MKCYAKYVKECFAFFPAEVCVWIRRAIHLFFSWLQWQRSERDLRLPLNPRHHDMEPSLLTAELAVWMNTFIIFCTKRTWCDLPPLRSKRYICIYVCIYVYVYIMYTYVYIYACMYTCMSVCMYVCTLISSEHGSTVLAQPNSEVKRKFRRSVP